MVKKNQFGSLPLPSTCGPTIRPALQFLKDLKINHQFGFSGHDALYQCSIFMYS